MAGICWKICLFFLYCNEATFLKHVVEIYIATDAYDLHSQILLKLILCSAGGCMNSQRFAVIKIHVQEDKHAVSENDYSLVTVWEYC